MIWERSYIIPRFFSKHQGVSLRLQLQQQDMQYNAMQHTTMGMFQPFHPCSSHSSDSLLLVDILLDFLYPNLSASLYRALWLSFGLNLRFSSKTNPHLALKTNLFWEKRVSVFLDKKRELDQKRKTFLFGMFIQTQISKY